MANFKKNKEALPPNVFGFNSISLILRLKVLIFIGGFLNVTIKSNAQSFTLQQCIDYANRNNSQITVAEQDIAIADSKIKEQLGTMLPTIDGSASYTNNIKQSTTLIPMSSFGAGDGYYKVHMGTKHNISAGLSANQKILDPTFYNGLKQAKVNKILSKQTVQQTQEQVIYNISKAYFQALIIQKRSHILESTLGASEKTLLLSQQKYENGITKKIDVDKIQVNTNNTRTQLQQNQMNFNQTLNILQYYMGYPVDSLIDLADTNLEAVFTKESQYIYGDLNVENKVDYQMQQTQLLICELEKKQRISSYYPVLSFSAAYNYNSMNEEFNFFKSDATWYNSSNIGLSLKVPVFTGFQKRQKVSQSKINIIKAKENLKLTEQSLKVDISNYEIQYQNALENIHDQKLNLDLAQSVYNDTYQQYQEGIGTSIDLIQAEASLRESQNNYFSRLLDLFIARLDLEQSKGNLIKFVNNLK